MSILSLIYRTAGAWGAGKGARLTPAEVDENFYDIQAAFNDLSENPAQPAQIDEIIVDGNQMTIVLSNAVEFGPYTLPTATFRLRGDWAPTTEYLANDLFRAEDPDTGDAFLYFVNRDFTSGTEFVPELGTGIGGASPYASPLIPYNTGGGTAIPQINWFVAGKPGLYQDEHELELGSSDDFIPMFSYATAVPFQLSETLPGSVARLRRAPTGFAVYQIFKNEQIIGSLQFSSGATEPLFFGLGEAVVQFEVGDVLYMTTPVVGIDSTADTLSVSIVCEAPEAASSSSA